MRKFIDKLPKNKLIIFSILVVVLLVVILTVTFSFFAARFIDNGQLDITVKSYTTDEFVLSAGNPLKLVATPTTLKENGENAAITTTATAALKANSKDNTATYQYYLYFEILNNDFVMSDGTTPEIILTISGPDGEVTSLDGLTYGSYNGVSGFDITEVNGFFAISSDSITSNSSKAFTSENWDFTITYLNLSFEQSANLGKSLNANIILRKTQMDLVDVTVSSSSVTVEGTTSVSRNVPSMSVSTFRSTATTSNTISCTNGATATISSTGLVSVTPSGQATVCTIS